MTISEWASQGARSQQFDILEDAMKNIITIMLVAVFVSVWLPAFAEEYLPEAKAPEQTEDCGSAAIQTVAPAARDTSSVFILLCRKVSALWEFKDAQKDQNRKNETRFENLERRMTASENAQKEQKRRLDHTILQHNITVDFVNKHEKSIGWIIKEKLPSMEEAAVTVGGLFGWLFLAFAFVFGVLAVVYLFNRKTSPRRA